MLGFKRFETAAITISGIELAEKIRKHQFMTGNLPGKPATAPDIWAAILAARPPSTSFQSPDHVHWQSLHQNREKQPACMLEVRTLVGEHGVAGFRYVNRFIGSAGGICRSPSLRSSEAGM
jgi:hypothetical protein